MHIKNLTANKTFDDDILLIATVAKNEPVQDILDKFNFEPDKYELEIKKKVKKRSNDANAALWEMLTKMAAILKTTKDELYLEVLDRYGVFTHIVVKPNVVERVKAEWKTVRELGEVTINGKTGVQLQCFFGSSTYDSKEFSVLLDGVIQEAKEIGVNFISSEEQARLIREWGKK